MDLQQWPEPLFTHNLLPRIDAFAIGMLGLCSKGWHRSVSSKDDLWRAMLKAYWPHDHEQQLTPKETHWSQVFARQWVRHAKTTSRRVTNTRQYWDEFFAKDESDFDWFVDFELLDPFIRPHSAPVRLGVARLPCPYSTVSVYRRIEF